MCQLIDQRLNFFFLTVVRVCFTILIYIPFFRSWLIYSCKDWWAWVMILWKPPTITRSNTFQITIDRSLVIKQKRVTTDVEEPIWSGLKFSHWDVFLIMLFLSFIYYPDISISSWWPYQTNIESKKKNIQQKNISEILMWFFVTGIHYWWNVEMSQPHCAYKAIAHRFSFQQMGKGMDYPYSLSQMVHSESSNWMIPYPSPQPPPLDDHFHSFLQIKFWI